MIFSNQTSAMSGFVQQMSWEKKLGKKEVEINTYDWAYVAMAGTEKTEESCLSACWSKQFRLSCYWVPAPSTMLLVSCHFLPFDVKVLTPFHFDSHKAVPSIQFESLHISAAERRSRVDKQGMCVSLPDKHSSDYISEVISYRNSWFFSLFDNLVFVSRQCKLPSIPTRGAGSQRLLQFEEQMNGNK